MIRNYPMSYSVPKQDTAKQSDIFTANGPKGYFTQQAARPCSPLTFKQMPASREVRT
jgi:hypothetical protein